MLLGKSLCVIVFGTTGSGKSFTIRGGEGKKRGLALRSVELLLTIVERQRSRIQIKVSVIAIFDEKIIDLLNKQSPPEEFIISKTSDFHAALNQALKNRKSVSDRQNKDKIHMIICIKLYSECDLLSEAFFVELAGAEFACDDKTVARAFNSISNQLTLSTSSWQNNTLSMYLNKGLDIYGNNPAYVLLICCASQDQNIFKDTLASLKFTSRIKECIEKDDLKPDLMHVDNLIFYINQLNIEDSRQILESMAGNIKKYLSEEIMTKNKDLLARHKQIQRETLSDIEESKLKSQKNNEDQALSKTLQELFQLKHNYSILQDQYNLVLEEKTQISLNYSKIHSILIDDLLVSIKFLSTKLQDEQEIFEKIIKESKNIRNHIFHKSFYKEPNECNCSEELKSLQKAIRQISEDREKIMERLEISIKENRTKEEQIQSIHFVSNNYEEKIQNLTSIISDYENLIYELRKSLNSMSSSLSQLEEDKLTALQDNERLRSHCKILKEKIEKNNHEAEEEVLKYKQACNDCNEKYESLVAKFDSLSLELTKTKLSNNHLKIENKGLIDELEAINFNDIDKKIRRVYDQFEKVKKMISVPVFDNC